MKSGAVFGHLDEQIRYRAHSPTTTTTRKNGEVSFGKQDALKHDPIHGAGLGFFVAFDTKGFPVQFLQFGPLFNAPCGIALAPSDFGGLSHRLLTGNFGDGHFLVFNELMVASWAKCSIQKVSRSGLMGFEPALSFASGDPASSSGFGNVLYFTAGPNNESDGLFGNLTVDPNDLVPGNGQ
jgi:uncharacterized protein (TIGR03118 family)